MKKIIWSSSPSLFWIWSLPATRGNPWEFPTRKMADTNICEEALKFGLVLHHPREAVRSGSLRAFPDPPELPEHLQKKLCSFSDYERAPLCANFFFTGEKAKRKSTKPSRVHQGEQTEGRPSSGSGFKSGRKERTKERNENEENLSAEVEVGKQPNPVHENEENLSAEIEVSKQSVQTAQPVRVNTFEDGRKKRNYECSLCKFQRITRAAVVSHINRTHCHQTHHCSECTFQTTNPDCFHQHVKNCGSNLLKCPRKHCDFVTRKKHDLDRHSVSHTGQKHWHCQNCRKGFKLKQGLTKHQSGHCKTRISQQKQKEVERGMNELGSVWFSLVWWAILYNWNFWQLRMRKVCCMFKWCWDLIIQDFFYFLQCFQSIHTLR